MSTIRGVIGLMGRCGHRRHPSSKAATGVMGQNLEQVILLALGSTRVVSYFPPGVARI